MKASEVEILAYKLADASARSLIWCNTVSVKGRDGEWMHGDEFECGEEIRYLELRGLLRRDSDDPNVVQFIDPKKKGGK